MITHRERLETCLSGARPDRVPVALWRHFPVDDQTPESLANAVIDFQEKYDFDLVKVTPESSFCVKDWGVEDEWRGDSEGTRLYTRRIITRPEDWSALQPLDPHKGHLAAQLNALRRITSHFESETPVLQTIFSPMHQAKNLAGNDLLLVHMREYPQAVHQGLQTITESTRRFIEAALETGIAGLFYAVHHAQYGMLSEPEFQAFVKAYDLLALEPAQKCWCNMLHLHGNHVMFHLALDYPIQIINWHDQETPPSLAEARRLYPGVLCGGIKRLQTLLLSKPQQIRAEALAAIDALGGEKFILGTGCVTQITTPHGNLMAVRKAVEI